MNCIVCHMERESHSEEMWKLHQQPLPCTFCNRSSSEHSETLWGMHKAAVEKGQFCPDHKKKEKLYPITVGFSRKGIARVCRTNADPPHDVEFVSIYMSCTECSLYLGSDEEDYAYMLGGMCFSCFRKLIGQTDVWYDKPPTKLDKLYDKNDDCNKKRNSDQTKIDREIKINTLSTIPEKRGGKK